MMQNISSVDLWHFSCTGNYTIKCEIAYWVWRTVPFIWFAIGITGNFLNFVVLSRPKMRKYSTTVYLLFLAGSDTALLCTVLMADTIYSVAGISLEDQSAIYCRLNWWFRYTSGSFSIWLLVLLTVERTLYTKAPVFARSKLTKKTSLILSLITLATIAIGNIHLIVGFEHYTTAELEIFVEDFVPNWACYAASKEYERFFDGTWTIFVLVFYTIVPTAVIFIGNANIAVVLLLKRRQFGRVEPLPGSSRATDVSVIALTSYTRRTHPTANADCGTTGSDPASSIRSRTFCGFKTNTNNILVYTNRPKNTERKTYTTRLLFTISAFFLVTILPYCIYSVVKGTLEQLDESGIENWRLLTVFVLISLWSNFTFNFFLYFMSGTLFKQEWNRIMKKLKTRIYI